MVSQYAVLQTNQKTDIQITQIHSHILKGITNVHQITVHFFLLFERKKNAKNPQACTSIILLAIEEFYNNLVLGLAMVGWCCFVSFQYREILPGQKKKKNQPKCEKLMLNRLLTLCLANRRECLRFGLVLIFCSFFYFILHLFLNVVGFFAREIDRILQIYSNKCKILEM